MPARSVVIEKLTKFTGEHHAFLTPGEYTQLTGRAGRRGIDTSATPSCCGARSCRSTRSRRWRRAARSTCARRSGRPTTWPPTWCGRTRAEQAHHLLNLSFAQYQADRDVVRLEARLERREAVLAELRRAADEPVRRHRGVPPARRRDADRRAATDAEPARDDRGGSGPAAARRRASCSTRAATPGPGGGADRRPPQGRACGCEASRPTGPSCRRRRRRLRRAAAAPSVASSCRRRSRRTARASSARWPGARAGQAGARCDRRAGSRRRPPSGTPRPSHPVTDDPDLRGSAAGGRPGRAGGPRGRRPARPGRQGRSEIAGPALRPRAAHPRGVGLPRRLGADRRGASGWPGCSTSATCWSSRALRQGLLDDLDPPTLAALVSVFTYEHRSPEPPPAPWFPSAPAAQALAGHRGASPSELRGRRGGGRPRRHPAARPDVRRRGLRVGGGGGLRRGGGGRGAVRAATSCATSSS